MVSKTHGGSKSEGPETFKDIKKTLLVRKKITKIFTNAYALINAQSTLNARSQ